MAITACKTIKHVSPGMLPEKVVFKNASLIE